MPVTSNKSLYVCAKGFRVMQVIYYQYNYQTISSLLNRKDNLKNILSHSYLKSVFSD